MKKIRAWLLGLAVILALSCLPDTARAYDWLPGNIAERTCELTVTVADRRPDATIKAYRVCTVNQWVQFEATAAFARYRDEIRSLANAGKWDKLRDNLQYVYDLSGIKPTAEEISNKDGECTFKGLPTGIYYVFGYRETAAGRIYRTSPFLICLPNWVHTGNGAGGEWRYEGIEAVTKPWPETPDKIKVYKKWVGVGAKDNMPDRITVGLWKVDPKTKKEEFYGEMVLDRWNRWTDIWTNLPEDWEWKVREIEGSEEFEVDYDWSSGEYNVTVTNSYDPDDGGDRSPPPSGDNFPGDTPKGDRDNPPGRPGNPGTPGNPPVMPGNPSVTPPEGPPNIPGEDLEDLDTPLTRPEVEEDDPRDDDPEDEEDLDDDDPPLARLPQTGVLWWPVPILALSGMFLFILGWGLRRREQYDEE